MHRIAKVVANSHAHLICYINQLYAASDAQAHSFPRARNASGELRYQMWESQARASERERNSLLN